MKLASFNVLADAYISFGDYSHVEPGFLKKGNRLKYIVENIKDINADIIGLQEADIDLVNELQHNKIWQAFWTQKSHNNPDGYLTLVKNSLPISSQESYSYNDETGHIFQITKIGELAIANTHLRWAPSDDPEHLGYKQASVLIEYLSSYKKAVILADGNDRPGGPVRSLIKESGFTNLSGNRPTALVNNELASIDLLAIRGLRGKFINTNYSIKTIPNKQCASDHIPLVAEIDL